MKLVLFLCFFFSFQSLAINTFSQKRISLNMKGATITGILKAIENRSDYRFVYGTEVATIPDKMDLYAKNADIDYVMQTLLKSTTLSYKKLSNDLVVVVGEDVNYTVAIPITGKISDASGAPVSGVSIVEKGTTNGTTSADDGSFSIEVKDNLAVLVITSVGYIPQEVQVNNKTDWNIILKREDTSMDDVLVIGYGTVKRRDLVGAVGSLKGDEIAKAATATFQDALSGRIAGVQVTATDGSPGGGVQIKIRGGSTLTAGNQPLYVIDGFPISPAFGLDHNPMSDINPSDIISVEILKDASATAIYGAEGANGVILVTTKKGHLNAKPVTDFSVYTGITQPLKQLRVLNPEEYIAYKIHALNQTVEQRLAIPGWQEKDPAEGKNWMNEILHPGNMFNADLGIRGGGSSTVYSVNLNYYTENGIIKESNYRRYSGRIKLDQNIGKRLTVGFKMFYSNTERDGFMQEYAREQSLFKTAIMMSPFSLGLAAPGLASDAYTASAEQNFLDNNLHAVLYESTKNRISERVQPQLNLQYKILQGLTFDFMYGADRVAYDYALFYPSSTRQGFTVNGRAQVQKGSMNSWYQNSRLNYVKTFNEKHTLNALAVFETKGYRDYSYTQAAEDFSTELLGVNNLQMAGNLAKPVIVDNPEHYLSYIGRINYDYANKYLINASIRRDGSSKFGANNKYANFPAVGLAWRIDKENFMSRLDLVSSFKIRYGWGITGNSQIPPFVSLASYATDMSVFDDDFATAIVPSGLSNQDLRWETTTQHNIGLDLGFLNDRINLTADVYDKHTTDLLFEVQLPTTSGYKKAIKNIGAIRNKGLEITLNTVNIRNKSFRWSTDFNISFNRSKILKLGDAPMQLYSYPVANGVQNNIMLKEGMPLGVFYGYIGDGVYNTYTEIAHSSVNNVINLIGEQLLGQMKFADVNGDGIVNALDRVPIAYTEPKFIAGFVNNFTYKNFDLGIVLRAIYGNDVVNANIGDFADLGLASNNLKVNVDNMWQHKVPMNNYVGVSKVSRRAFMHSEYVEDGSFLRCDRISLGYSIPGKTAERMKVRSLKVFFNVRNAFLITRYSWYDPEISAGNTMTAKLAPGMDLGGYPRTRQFQLGINASF
ncbi:MAG: TonB-dependent receptor [Niabella sp.]